MREHLGMAKPFRGWSDAAFDFYRELEVENTRTFWAAHKTIYEAEVRAPFEALSDVVGDEFGHLKVFRPNRDLRFSRDKTPYKTRCYAVAEGDDGATFYLEISANGLLAATGYWMMAKDQLARYREAVDDEDEGEALAQILATLRRRKLEIEGQRLKTAPRTYARDHPRIDLLRCKSLAAMRSYDPAGWMGTKAAVQRITGVWRAAADMNQWLADHVGRSTETAVAPR